MIEIVAYADARHRDAVVALWTATFGYTEPRNAPGTSIDRKVAWDDGLFFVATNASRVVGTVMAGYDGHRGWIYSLAVDVSARREGIGSKLLRHAEDALTRLGCMKINLQLVAENAAVAAFYEANGYAVERRISICREPPGGEPEDTIDV